MRTIKLFTTFTFVIGFPLVAFADSPHFTSATAAIGSDGQLSVSFKEAGLGSNQNVAYVASADAVANYGCVNQGGNNPNASNKRTAAGPVTQPATYASGKNGSISQTMKLSPPPKPSDFSCPGGQKLVLADVTFSNVRIEDTTTPVAKPISGSFAKTFVTFK